MKSISWKELSLLFVYTAAALISVSDTGVQLLLMKYVGSNTSILREIALALLFIKLAGTRYTRREFFIILPLTLLSLYNYRVSGNIYCFYNILFAACMKDIDYCRLFKVLFFSTSAAVIILGLLSFFGIGGVVSITQDYGRGSIETRYCFGLYHPNLWHQAAARCMVFFVLAYHKILNWRGVAVLFFLNLIAYAFSVSRTGLISVSVFLTLFLLYRYCPKLMNLTFVKIGAFTCAFGIFAGYFLMLIDYFTFPTLFSQFFNKELATGRLGQAALYLIKNPIQLFGTRFPDDGTLFDCGFLRMLSESGYLLGAIFMISLFALLVLSLKKNWGHITAVIFFIILYSLYEVHPITRVPYNIPVFYFGLLLYPQQQRNLERTS